MMLPLADAAQQDPLIPTTPELIIGLICFIIPGLILMTLFCLAGPLINIEGRGPLFELRHSTRLIRHRFFFDFFGSDFDPAFFDFCGRGGAGGGRGAGAFAALFEAVFAGDALEFF